MKPLEARWLQKWRASSPWLRLNASTRKNDSYILGNGPSMVYECATRSHFRVPKNLSRHAQLIVPNRGSSEVQADFAPVTWPTERGELTAS